MDAIRDSRRRWFGRRAAGVGVLTFVLLMLSAGGASGRSGFHFTLKTPRNQTLVVVLPQAGNYNSLGWMMNADSKSLWAVTADPIMARDHKTWKLNGDGLFTSWSHTGNFKTWTFNIRHKVMWQGGYGELTSADFIYTVNRILEKTSTGSAAGFFQNNLASVTPGGKYTVVMTFKTGQFQVPRQLSYAPFTIMSHKYVAAVGDATANAKPIGTGPYQYVGGTPGQEYDFVAFPHQWRITPHYKYLTVLIQPDSATALAGLQSGSIDIAPMSGDLLKEGMQHGLKLHETPRSAQVVLLLGGVTPKGFPDYCPSCPWVGDQSDPASAAKAKLVREALNFSIDRKAIINAVFAGHADTTPFVFYWYPQVKGWSKKWTYNTYNLALAKKLMVQAGYPNGFTIQINPLSSNPVIGPDIVQSVAQYWSKIGVTVKEVPEAFSTYLAKLTSRNTNNTGWGILTTAYIFDDPVAAWTNVMTSTAPNGEIMPEFYDQQVALGNASVNPIDRLKIETSIANSVASNYWVINIAFAATDWLTSSRVHNWDTIVGYTYTNSLETVN